MNEQDVINKIRERVADKGYATAEFLIKHSISEAFENGFFIDANKEINAWLILARLPGGDISVLEYSKPNGKTGTLYYNKV